MSKAIGPNLILLEWSEEKGEYVTNNDMSFGEITVDADTIDEAYEIALAHLKRIEKK